MQRLVNPGLYMPGSFALGENHSSVPSQLQSCPEWAETFAVTVSQPNSGPFTLPQLLIFKAPNMLISVTESASCGTRPSTHNSLAQVIVFKKIFLRSLKFQLFQKPKHHLFLREKPLRPSCGNMTYHYWHIENKKKGEGVL